MAKYYTILFIYFLLSACSADKQTEKLLMQVDSVLEEYPDSALHLLNALPNPQELSRKESARYALLFVRATDKAVKSLLPCDSLLNIALHYYDKDEKERAVALLYKGRLETEMNNVEEAIAYLQEGITILEAFPKEIETRRLTLNSLGNLYFDARYYEEAIKKYRKLYAYCITDKDKSIALNGISSYYYMINKEDSAIIIQRKALEYAITSSDSEQVAKSEFNLSLYFGDFEKLDSALHHAYNAIKWQGKKIRGNYYANLGSLLLEKEEKKDSAIHYLNKSMEDSTSIKGKASALLELYNIEKERGNYKAAINYIEDHIVIVDSLANIESSTAIQQLIYDHKTKQQIRKEKIRGRRQIRFITTSSIFSCLLIIIFYQYRINKRKKTQLIYQLTLNKVQSQLFSFAKRIEENQHIITSLQKEYDSLKQEKDNKTREIEERECTIEALRNERQKLKSWLFTQSSIYKTVDALSKQKAAKKKDMKIMTSSERKELKETIFDIYADSISQMQEKSPKLVEDDILYLCLEDALIDQQTIALCFGYIDTHTINQRKYRIKEKTNRRNM